MNEENHPGSDGAHGSIIDINTRAPVVAVKRGDWPSLCRCRTILIDAHLRTVCCQQCGKVLDPFDWIKAYGMNEASIIGRIQHLEAEARKRAETVEALRAEEQKVKTRIREAKNRLLGSMGV